MQDDLHTRVVGWLKILLPLMALAILSTLFLLSRNIDPGSTLPFTDGGLEERARAQQITDPEFSGATDAGDLVELRADSARPDPERQGFAQAENLSARIRLRSGGEITFTALQGSFDSNADIAQLSGDVVVTSTTGYTITTAHLTSALRDIHAETQGPVKGHGPLGRFTAGKMVIDGADRAAGVRMFFTNGVRLIYDPEVTKE